MPKGFIHLDGDNTNFSPNNLFEVTTDELRIFYKQRYQKMSPEQTKARLLEIRLNNVLKSYDN